ncbi:hypothetical protein [Microlunatus sp. Y2014]|uniref:hypothetical protein n=1 Tax=Microlunatus sp. Y2014 TaxID=3418488 RepID=UPI003DA772C0
MANTEQRLTEVEGLLAELSEVLEGQTRLVGQLADTVQRGHWDPDVPEDLDAWVTELTSTYYLGDDLAGWTSNSAIVEELKALRVLHRSMVGPKAAASTGVQFHDALARVIDRLPSHKQRRTRETH